MGTSGVAPRSVEDIMRFRRKLRYRAEVGRRIATLTTMFHDASKALGTIAPAAREASAAWARFGEAFKGGVQRGHSW